MATAPPSYQPQMLPRPARLAEPGPGAGDYLAEGLGALGQAETRHEAGAGEDALRITQAQDQAKQIEEQRYLQGAASKISVAVASAQGTMQVANAESRQNPDTAGHLDRVEANIQAFHDTVSGMLGPDPRLQAEFLPDIARVAATARTGEHLWSAEQNAVGMVQDGEVLRNQLGSNMQTAELQGTATDQMQASAETQWRNYVARLPLPAAAQTERLNEGLRTILMGRAYGRIERDPQAVIDAIGHGWGADLLDPHQRETIYNQAQAQLHQNQARAQAAAGAQIEQANAASRNLIEDVDHGVLVDQGQLDAALSAAQAAAQAGGPHAAAAISLAHDLANANMRNRTTAQYDPRPPADRLAAMREIEGHAGWQSDPNLVAAHTQLQHLNERDQAQASNDMLGLYVRQTGAHLPQFNLADPNAMRAYFNAGDAAAQRYAVPGAPAPPPQYLPHDAAEALHQQWLTGTPAARAQMVQQVAAYGAGRAGALLRQITPEPGQAEANAALVSLATMRDRGVGAAYVREALDGWAVPQNERVSQPARMQAQLRANFGAALQGMPGDVRAATIRVAEGIYAHRAAQRNLNAFDDGLWQQSMSAALGQVGDTGGLGHAMNGDPFVLPRGWAQNDIHVLIARSAGDPRMIGRAAGSQGQSDTPMWGNHVVPPATMLSMTPELIADDGRHAFYRFRAASGYVTSQRHPRQDFVLDVRALGAIVHGQR